MAASSDVLPRGWAIEVVAMPSKAFDYAVKDLVRLELVRLLRGSGFPATDEVHGQFGSAAVGLDVGLIFKGISVGMRALLVAQGFFTKHLRKRRRGRIPDFVIMIETGFLPDVVRPLVSVLPDLDIKLKEKFPTLRCSYEITAKRSRVRPATVSFPTDMLSDSLALRALFELDSVGANETAHIAFLPRPWWRVRPQMKVLRDAANPPETDEPLNFPGFSEGPG